MKANLKLATPTIEKQTVRQRASKNPEGRKPNVERYHGANATSYLAPAHLSLRA
jgi:hypothetical protein